MCPHKHLPALKSQYVGNYTIQSNDKTVKGPKISKYFQGQKNHINEWAYYVVGPLSNQISSCKETK